MRKVGAVVLAGSPVFSELPPPPIREREVLVKVLSAALTPTDIAAVKGLVPYAYGKIIGSAGLVRVLDSGHGVAKPVVGENAVVVPKCFIELAVYRDGVMAEQASLDSECLEPVPQSISGLTGLYISLLAHLPSVVRSLSGSSMLIAGCGYEGSVLARLVRDVISTEAVCVSEVGLRRIAKLGIRAHMWDKAQGKYDVVYIASLDPYVNSSAVRKCGESLYISPTVPEHLVPLGGGFKKVVPVSQVKPSTSEVMTLIRGVSYEVESVFKVVDDLKAAAESVGYSKYVAYVLPPETRRPE